MHDGISIAYGALIGHGKEGIGTVNEGSGRSHGHQGIHVWSLVEERAESVYEKFLVYGHYEPGKEHLIDAYAYGIILKKSRKGPAPHDTSHGYIHKGDEEAQGYDEPSLKLRSLRILEHILIFGD